MGLRTHLVMANVLLILFMTASVLILHILPLMEITFHHLLAMASILLILHVIHVMANIHHLLIHPMMVNIHHHLLLILRVTMNVVVPAAVALMLTSKSRNVESNKKYHGIYFF